MNEYFFDKDTVVEYKVKGKQVLYAPSEQDHFDVSMVVSFPKDTIEYVPRFWTEFKYAWVKYAAMFALFYAILYNFFLNTIITKGAFDTVNVADLDLSAAE